MPVTFQRCVTELMLNVDTVFYSTVLMQLDRVEDRSVETLSTDGRTLRYNPDFLSTLSHDVAVSAVLHDLLHVCNLDPYRLQGRDPVVWNRAIDYRVNSQIKQMGRPIGDDWLFDPQYENKAPEAIYNDLMAKHQVPKQTQGPGQVEAPKTPDQAGLQAAEQQTVAGILQAAATSESKAMAGKLPGELEEWIKRLRNPAVDWRTLLRQYAEHNVRREVTWQRPNRRFLPDLYLPSLAGKGYGTIAILWDTSGSVTAYKELFERSLGESQSILDELRPASLVLIECDYKVQFVGEYEPGDVLDKTAHGGGGTRLQPALDKAEEYSPDCIVFFTDGQNGSETVKDPGCPVLWVLYGQEPRRPATWGEVVEVIG